MPFVMANTERLNYNTFILFFDLTARSLRATILMYTLIETEAFSTWLGSIRDRMTRLRLVRRINKVRLGQLGDVKPVGHGVWEMREFFGPGWRMYYIQRGRQVILMLGGGDKSTQHQDIAKAITIARELYHAQDDHQDPAF